MFSTSELADLSAVVESTMVHSVTLVAPGAGTAGPLGAAVPGAPVEVATVAARVRQLTAEEILASDRPADTARFTVRVKATETTSAVTGAYSLTWHRAEALGGDLSMSVVGVVDAHGRGRYLDIIATAGVSS